MKKYSNSGHVRNYALEAKERARKPKIRRCSKCRLYFDDVETYPDHFVWYGAPLDICNKCKDE